jgi:hypothetical protein
MLGREMSHLGRVDSSLLRVRWRETLGLMLAAWLVPFLVHLAPSFGPRPVGVYLLPAFWTAFVAVYFNGVGVGLLVAMVTPVVSLLIAGLPALDWLGTMSIELTGFVFASAWMVKRWPRFWLAAPLAYIPAKALAIGVQWMVPALGESRNPFTHLLDSVSNGLAGLAVLLFINLVLVRLDPGDADWDGE